MFLLFVATNLQSPKNEPPIHLYFTSLKKNNSPATFWSQSHAAPSSQILSCSGQKGLQPRYEDLTGSMWNTPNHRSSYQAPETMPKKSAGFPSMIHHISLMINKINMWLGHAGTPSHGIFLNGPQQKIWNGTIPGCRPLLNKSYGTCGELVLWPMDGMIWYI
jgi:hypothetical protein